MRVLSFVRTLALLTRIGPLKSFMIVGRKVHTLFARDGKQLQISLRSQRMSNTEFGRAIGRRPRISSGSGLAGVCARFLHPHWQHNKLLLSAASDYDQDIYHRGFSWRWSQRPKPRPDKIYSPSASAKTPSSRFLAISASQALCTAGVR
jgi:hypothetical protein